MLDKFRNLSIKVNVIINKNQTTNSMQRVSKNNQQTTNNKPQTMNDEKANIVTLGKKTTSSTSPQIVCGDVDDVIFFPSETLLAFGGFAVGRRAPPPLPLRSHFGFMSGVA